jgi:hypothetical protein
MMMIMLDDGKAPDKKSLRPSRHRRAQTVEAAFREFRSMIFTMTTCTPQTCSLLLVVW